MGLFRRWKISTLKKHHGVVFAVVPCLLLSNIPPGYWYTYVASVSSTGRTSWSVFMITLKRTSPGLTPLAVTRQVAFAFGARLPNGMKVSVLPIIEPAVTPVEERY